MKEEMTTEPRKPNFSLATLSDDQVRDLFYYLGKARLILQQDKTFEDCLRNEDQHYSKMWYTVNGIEAEVFDEHLKREKSNLNK
jgi:hypothetical protein